MGTNSLVVPLLLIILFFNWLLWALWFNLANVWFGHLRVKLMASLLLLIFVAYWMVLRFWASPLVRFFLFILLVRWIKQGYSPCKGAPEVKKCPINFWYVILMFCPKTNLSAPFLTPVIDLLALASFLWLDLHASS